MCCVKAEQQTGATLANEWVTHLYISKYVARWIKESEKGTEHDVNNNDIF